MRLIYSLIVLIFFIGIAIGGEYFTIRRDLRKCAAPFCGGLFLKRVNAIEGTEEAKEIYTNGMQMIDANIRIEKLKDQANIIVNGEITEPDEEYHLPSLFLKGIHQRMVLPLNDKETPVRPRMGKVKESHFLLSNSDIKCKQAKGCPIYTASKVNCVNSSVNFSTYKEPFSSAVPLMQSDWFKSRLVVADNHYIGSIVVGSISKGELSISDIFINTIDPIYPCEQKANNCPSGQIETFTRSVNRCPVFDKCVKRGPCHLGLPHCPTGYKMYSIASAPKGCMKHYCDPESLPNPLEVQGP